jgi:hypothetical protein
VASGAVAEAREQARRARKASAEARRGERARGEARRARRGKANEARQGERGEASIEARRARRGEANEPIRAGGGRGEVTASDQQNESRLKWITGGSREAAQRSIPDRSRAELNVIRITPWLSPWDTNTGPIPC